MDVRVVCEEVGGEEGGGDGLARAGLAAAIGAVQLQRQQLRLPVLPGDDIAAAAPLASRDPGQASALVPCEYGEWMQGARGGSQPPSRPCLPGSTPPSPAPKHPATLADGSWAVLLGVGVNLEIFTPHISRDSLLTTTPPHPMHNSPGRRVRRSR